MLTATHPDREEAAVLRFVGAGASHPGRVREQNEDSAWLAPHLALVADGVGGAAAGEVASATVAYVVGEAARRRYGEEPAGVLEAGVATAGERLTRGVDADADRRGMATTLTGVLTDGSRVVMAHVGDSRCYLFRDQRLVRISTDHTYVQKLVDDGHLEPAAARRHPWRHVVLRSLHGAADGPVERADVIELPVRAGDRLLLCSDGLTDLVEEHRIGEILHVPSAQAAAERLVHDALDAGGTDNVTCVVVDLVEGPETTDEEPETFGAVRDVANVIGATEGVPDSPS